MLLDGRYEGKFVSPNVINLSKRHLSKDEIYLSCKGLKRIPTPKQINKARIKEEFETYGRKPSLMWHYRNEKWEIIIYPFKKKSKFNPKWKDTAIEIYLSRLEKEIFSLDKTLSYSNLTKEERHAQSSRRVEIVVWETKDYLAQARTQVRDNIPRAEGKHWRSSWEGY